MLLAFGVVLIALCIISCSPQLPASIGRVRQIALVTDYHKLVDSVAKLILQESIYTPQPEPEFLIRYEPIKRLEAVAALHFVFIVGTIEDEPVRQILDSRLAEIEKDTFSLLAIPQPWAKNQKVLVFAAQKESLLVTGLTKYSARIRYTFQQWVMEQMRKLTYQRGYNKRFKAKTLEKYNFAFDLPPGFKMVDKYEFDKFIYFVNHNPDRSIFCYYEDGIKPLTKDNLLAFRDSLTAQFYDGDFVVKELSIADTVRFWEVRALKIRGVWQNPKLVAGGPFVSYCFNYQNRFYYLDGMVFNPGKHKLDNLNQIDVILQTFELK
jgi:hypothetical protein